MKKIKQKLKVAVIGAGAAGMMAAIMAARNGVLVTVYEGMDKPGKKLLSTGNGKCNFSNMDMNLDNYYSRNEDFLARAFSQFCVTDTIAFFEELGLYVKNKNGYLYPYCEQAGVVWEVLKNELINSGVKLVTGEKITRAVKGADGKFLITTSFGTIMYDRMILACGGRTAPKTGSDGTGYLLAKEFGHKIIPQVPGLGQLICKEDYFKLIAGVRSSGHIQVYTKDNPVQEEYGEIQFTEYGISGIPVFQVSRSINYALLNHDPVKVVIDLMPDITMEELQKRMNHRLGRAKQETVEELFTGMLNKKLMYLFIKRSGLRPDTRAKQSDKEILSDILKLCKHLEVTVINHRGFDNAQVCAGGVCVEEITGEMESKLVPGLFFAGELMDVDGKCGGYNLQWAWTSGYIAGNAAAKI